MSSKNQKTKSIRSTFWIRWSSWEYWPSWLANIPVFMVWIWYGIRSLNLFYFSRVNPVIETGGVLGESKINILRRLPQDLIPKTLFFEANEANEDLILSKMEEAQIHFPTILKPDIGERGFLVEKIKSKEELRHYLKEVNTNILIQDLVDYPVEVSILHYRFPDQQQGEITSVCIKDMLQVTGDGSSTILDLMLAYPRAKLQVARFKKQYPDLLKEIPLKDKTVILEPIGNHSRGTTFLNGNAHIDAELTAVFDKISNQLEGMYYGRYDMKCTSIEALKKGEGFKILEFNGIASEPAHIYDPSYPVWRAYKDIFKHWKIIYKLSKAQKARGVKSMTFKEARQAVKEYRAYVKAAKKLANK